MDFDQLLFSGHAFRRMVERSISPADVERVLRKGDPVEVGPDSQLVLGRVRGRPLHVVASLDDKSRTCVVITVYHPDPNLWNRHFRTRRGR
jgi:Domain of unknown function (DUF4258)